MCKNSNITLLENSQMEVEAKLSLFVHIDQVIPKNNDALKISYVFRETNFQESEKKFEAVMSSPSRYWAESCTKWPVLLVGKAIYDQILPCNVGRLMSRFPKWQSSKVMAHNIHNSMCSGLNFSDSLY